MSTTGGVQGAGPINLQDIQGLDLETAMMAVQTNRANLLENELKMQIAAVDAKNKQIAKLNAAMSALNSVKAIFGGEDKATTTVMNSQTLKGKSFESAEGQDFYNNVQTPANDALAEAGYGNGMQELGTSQYGKNIQGDVTMGKVEAAISALKSQIDSLSNSQQMDMLRLQSLSNKRNEAFDVMTNFIKKLQDNRNSIVGNMR